MTTIEKTKQNRLKAVLSIYDNHVMYHRNAATGLTAGKPLTKKSLRDLFKFLNSDTEFTSMKFHGLVPSNILKYNLDNGDLVFYTEPMRKEMIFQKSLGIETAEYNIPYLLWIYRNDSLKIYALKKKPDNENDPIFQAPFLNVGSNGSVCMGNVRFKNTTGVLNNFDDQLVELFFNSVFTHTNCNDLATENIFKVYKKAKSKSFVWDKYLVDRNNILNDLL